QAFLLLWRFFIFRKWQSRERPLTRDKLKLLPVQSPGNMLYCTCLHAMVRVIKAHFYPLDCTMGDAPFEQNLLLPSATYDR
ncbi:MAG: hypothetical protein RR301_09030, partial [Clostridia bacterium]